MNSSSASLLSVSDDELLKLLGGKLKEKEREKTRCEEVLARKRRAPWDSGLAISLAKTTTSSV